MEKITLTMKEFCQLVGISQSTGYWLVTNRKINYLRIKGKILFERETVMEWLKDQEVKSEVKS